MRAINCPGGTTGEGCKPKLDALLYNGRIPTVRPALNAPMPSETAKLSDALREIDYLRRRVVELEAAEVARESAENALRESEESYRNTMDAALVGIYIIQDLVFQYVNPTMAQLFGYRADELEGKLSPIELVVPEQRDEVRQNLAKRAAGEPGRPYEVCCLRKDGSRFDAMVWGKGSSYMGRSASVGTLVDISVLKQAQQELVDHHAHLEQRVSEQTEQLRRVNTRLQRDIHARAAAEEQLRESKHQLLGLINATDEDVVVLLDTDLRVTVANERATRAFALPLGQVLGHTLSELVPSEETDQREVRIREVLISGRSIRFEDQRAGRWFDNNLCPVLDAEGKPRAVAVFARDITERMTMERALEQAKEQAERANQAKSRFLAAANHDLRQPLQALSLMLEAFVLSHSGGKSWQLIDDMKGTLQVMENLLNSLLDISKLEAGTIVPEKRCFRLSSFLQQLSTQFKGIAEEKGIRIQVCPTDSVLYTDPRLLERVLQNFISNAVRHAKRGRVLIGCRRAGDLRRIEVWDQGMGIPNDQLDKIFEEFYQLGNPARNRHQGLGLGLAIAKRAAQLLELRLGARSVPGKGSVFSIEVPVGWEPMLVEPSPSRRPVRVGEPRPQGVILVVDDDDSVRRASTDLLALWGFQPVPAASGEGAIELVLAGEVRPAIVVLDYRLPRGWNGIQLHSALQRILDRQLPGILLTGDTAAAQLREVQSSTLPLLHKPVDPTELYQLLRAQLMRADSA